MADRQQTEYVSETSALSNYCKVNIFYENWPVLFVTTIFIYVTILDS